MNYVVSKKPIKKFEIKITGKGTINEMIEALQDVINGLKNGQNKISKKSN